VHSGLYWPTDFVPNEERLHELTNFNQQQFMMMMFGLSHTRNLSGKFNDVIWSRTCHLNFHVDFNNEEYTANMVYLTSLA